MTHSSIKVHEVLYLPKIETDFKSIHKATFSKDLNFDTKSDEAFAGDNIYSKEAMFHCIESDFDPKTHVQVRLLSNVDLPFDFKTMNKIVSVSMLSQDSNPGIVNNIA